MSAEGRAQATDLLRRAGTPDGFLASPNPVSNYRRVWARDGVFCTLASLVSHESELIETGRRTLETLARYQGPMGEIPSNVLLRADGQAEQVSYGGLVGRSDAPAWFVIGVCSYVEHTKDRSLWDALAPSVERAMSILEAWEMNRGGLVYVPEGGSWADEYVLSGYQLDVQLLRYWALLGHAAIADLESSRARAAALAELIRVNYRPRPSYSDSKQLRHPVAYRSVLEDGAPPYWLATLRPGGYERRFDAFANALAILLGISNPSEDAALLGHVDQVSEDLGTPLVPAYWPPIERGDLEWATLANHHRGELRNRPCEYHNGGIWPMVNGLLGAALAERGHRARAESMLVALEQINRRSATPTDEWSFHEFVHARTRAPMGVVECAWSAAGQLLLEAALQGRHLAWTEHEG